MIADANPLITNIVCGSIFFIIVALPNFLLARLLKIEHDDFHPQWEKDGRPHGMPFWYPSEELQLLSFRSSPWRLGNIWLIKTPDWVKGHQAAAKLLMYYRLSSYSIYIGLIGLCLLVFLSTPK